MSKRVTDPSNNEHVKIYENAHFGRVLIKTKINISCLKLKYRDPWHGTPFNNRSALLGGSGYNSNVYNHWEFVESDDEREVFLYDPSGLNPLNTNGAQQFLIQLGKNKLMSITDVVGKQDNGEIINVRDADIAWVAEEHGELSGNNYLERVGYAHHPYYTGPYMNDYIDSFI
jgi:hypothetical protein